MKTTAIICEFNPLHSGHKMLIDYAKTFSDKVICIMSGNFTQRGMPACCDKYARARHAILSGADMVAELPVVFAAASAENFAYGATEIADIMEADYLLFGSECGDITELTQCAKLLSDKEINKKIASEIKNGVSYPKAVANAVNLPVLDKPNNVLGVEYIKALLAINSRVTPVTIKREDNYNGKPQQFASSGTLRENAELRKAFTYDYVIKDIDDNVEKRYGEVATAMLSVKSREEMSVIEGVSEGIENRIFSADKSHGYENMIEQIKTKRYTRLRLQRIILNTILNITTDDVYAAKHNAIAIRPLAIKSNSAALLTKTNEIADELTQKADRLYYALSVATPPKKLLKI